MAANILAYVEDPGAANYAIGLSSALSDRGIGCRLTARGAAVKFLRQRGEVVEVITSRVTAEELMDKEPLSAVVVGTSVNPNSLSFDLIQSARRRKIKSIGIVDAIVGSQYRFRGTSEDLLFNAPDMLFVPNEGTKQRFKDIGMPSGSIHVVGNPAIDYAIKKAGHYAKERFMESRSAIFGEDCTDRKVLVFISERSDGPDNDEYLKSEEYTLQGRGLTDARTKIVLEEVLDAMSSMSPRPELVVRLHPRESEAEYASYDREVLGFSHDPDPLREAYFADGVVGMSSSLLLEVAVMGVAVLSIVPREAERDWVPKIGDTRITTVTERSDIPGALESMMKKDWLLTVNQPDKASMEIIAEKLASL